MMFGYLCAVAASAEHPPIMPNEFASSKNDCYTWMSEEKKNASEKP